jgi:nitrate/nitrite-specific signal transduction histidine kinase
MWGEFKDKVDELTMIMMKNEYEFGELKTNLNNQLEMLKAAKARLNQLLGEARANLAADNEELKQKYQQKEELDIQYVKFMAACKKRINWIFYQDMCAIKIVRNAVMENSTQCPTSTMTDCDVGAWVPEECSVSCDDSCDPAMPYKCGGWQEMKREIVVPNDDCGVKSLVYRSTKDAANITAPLTVTCLPGLVGRNAQRSVEAVCNRIPVRS